jgi:hypothetical protein
MKYIYRPKVRNVPVFEYICLCCNKKTSVGSLSALHYTEHLCTSCKDLKEPEYLFTIMASRSPKSSKQELMNKLSLLLKKK